ncbi:porin [Paraburkholderia unamae]|uniref:GBP family porin n=1 Tax=Paraburkholderia unamae TaxID=219649 RepID=A0ABX5KYG4_9BURK|nr:porin [Paraburkholderia unamae]PVX85862.1 GBP family porin [Paraburkholderia unamae]
MYRKLSAMALAISLLSLSQLAEAQSSVTLYGLIDTGLTYVSNAGGKSDFLANDGIIQPGRFGFRGSEDLGGGLKAIFTLENGFSLNTGAFSQPGLIFGRQAFVGLSHPKFGALTLGRQYDFVWDYVTLFSMGSRIGAFGFHPGDYDHLAGSLRINNSVKYAVDPIGGLSIGALYAFGGQPASASNGRAVAAGARYTGGVFSVAFAYNNVRDMPLNPPAQIAASLGPSFPPGAFVAENMQNIEAAASVTFGPSSTRALFTATTIDDSKSSVTMRSYELSEVFQFTPSLSGSAGYSYTRMSPSAWRTISAILDYSLSKRTDVYLSAAYQNATGGARAAFLAIPASSNGNDVAVRVGIRTFF